ncbi:right-handed parallel beta-helix repeat-containing protein [Caulobacter hibisci]|uniref:Right-handed parallel beta-helix repeat-containing protein n=1 Tax=Caulobacter hibisci TaxID=2035993 RepID=A0ABS0SXU7_9CAUL|nr:right-handed parallel beta-helix repeat-containing protein [Caulobacter hibisci]MBI1684467.1 right-handed parallel beta-helix repeat-containing protein [Caulobacter hibisci]
MTVTLENPDTIFVPTGAAVGAFSTGWSYEEAGDVLVIIEVAGVEGPPLAVDGDFVLVSMAREAGGFTGEVTLKAAVVPSGGWQAAADHRLILRRVTAASQTRPFGQVEGFRPAVSEAAWDRQARLAQEMRSRQGRSLVAPAGEAGWSLPPLAERAGKLAMFDVDGRLAGAAGGIADGVPVTDFGRDLVTAADHRRGKLQLKIGSLEDVADPEGVVDATAGVAELVALYRSLGRREIPLGSGRFRMPASSGGFDVGVGGLYFVGEGASTVIFRQEGEHPENDPLATSAFFNWDANPEDKSGVGFLNLAFEGTLSEANPGAIGAPVIFLDWFPEVILENVSARNLKCMLADVHFCGRYRAENNVLINIARDGLRARDTPNAIVRGNTLVQIGDDVIAMHTSTGSVGSYPVREGLVITDNITALGGSIKALGARKVLIANNIGRLHYLAHINVVPGVAGPEGSNPMGEVGVYDNQSWDTHNLLDGGTAASAAHIVFGAPPVRGAAMSGGIIPTNPDPATGVFVKPWPYSQMNTDDPAHPVAPTPDIDINGNRFGRTLPAAAKISDYGYGKLQFQGEYSDPAVTDADLRIGAGISGSGVGAGGGFVKLTIEGNGGSYVGNGISLPKPVGIETYRDCRVADNAITDFSGRGFLLSSPDTKLPADIEVAGNVFDGDPLHVLANRNTGGRWTNGAAGPNAIDVGNAVGLVVRHNTYRNVCRPLAANYADEILVDANVHECDPVARGFDAGNRGIGELPYAGRPLYLIKDCDPTSASYGQIKNVPLLESNAQPAAGKYVAGHFVANHSPAVLGSAGSRYTITGWSRLTTGTAHVAGTDWAERRALTGT